jgi:hypothetical protein
MKAMLRTLVGWAFEPIYLIRVNRKLTRRISQWETAPEFADIRALDEGQLKTYLEAEWTRAKELDEKLYKITAALSVAVTVGGVLAKTIVDGLVPTIMKAAIEVFLFVSMGMFLLGALIGLSGLRPKVRYGYGADFLRIVAEGGEQSKKQ